MRVIEPPPAVLADLKARYSEPQRAYHSWSHIEALLALYETHKGMLRDPTRVLWAIYWHDAIYDPSSPDNEVKSAALLREQAAAHLPDALGFDVKTDCAAFLDFDLSILAAPEDVFDQYEANIRKEYSFVPEETFISARKATLERFVQRETLYFTPMLARQWDHKARANLRRSIGKLSDGIIAA